MKGYIWDKEYSSRRVERIVFAGAERKRRSKRRRRKRAALPQPFANPLPPSPPTARTRIHTCSLYMHRHMRWDAGEIPRIREANLCSLRARAQGAVDYWKGLGWKGVTGGGRRSRVFGRRTTKAVLKWGAARAPVGWTSRIKEKEKSSGGRHRQRAWDGQRRTINKEGIVYTYVCGVGREKRANARVRPRALAYALRVEPSPCAGGRLSLPYPRAKEKESKKRSRENILKGWFSAFTHERTYTFTYVCVGGWKEKCEGKKREKVARGKE